jgi:hypothetical protein
MRAEECTCNRPQVRTYPILDPIGLPESLGSVALHAPIVKALKQQTCSFLHIGLGQPERVRDCLAPNYVRAEREASAAVEFQKILGHRGIVL